MKILYLIRHAKSTWNFHHMNDFDRPLNKRGRTDVLHMSQWIAKNDTTPDSVITSTASRALYTALYFCDAWGIREEDIQLSPCLYHASSRVILEEIQKRKEGSIAVFGHNPGITELINLIANLHLDNLPTCAVCKVAFNVDHWKDIQKGQQGQLVLFKTPAALKKDLPHLNYDYK